MDDPVGKVPGMIQQKLRHFVGAAFHGKQSAPASDEYVYIVQCDPGLFQKAQDHIPAVGKLLRQIPKLVQLRRVVRYIFGIQALLSLE